MNRFTREATTLNRRRRPDCSAPILTSREKIAVAISAAMFVVLIIVGTIQDGLLAGVGLFVALFVGWFASVGLAIWVKRGET
jgi:hypothetical protein